MLTPSYGSFHTLPGARELESIDVRFRDEVRTVRVFEIIIDGVRTVLFEHGALAPTTPGLVYHDDGSMRPYATDANKFAFFCASAAAWIDALPAPPDAVHLHDWHAAYYLLQRNYSSLADKLGKRSAEEVAAKTIVIQGVMCLQAGDNPRNVHSKLMTFIPPKERPAEDEKQAA